MHKLEEFDLLPPEHLKIGQGWLSAITSQDQERDRPRPE